MVEVGGQGGRARQRAALLVAHSDFQTLRHPCKLVPIFVGWKQTKIHFSSVVTVLLRFECPPKIQIMNGLYSR